MRPWFLPVVALLCWLAPSVALACKSDTECKGQRVCVRGKCVQADDTATSAPATSVPDKPVADHAPVRHRAKGRPWSLSLAANSVVAWRDGGQGVSDGVHLGLGGWVAWEPGSLPMIVAAEFVHKPNGLDAGRLAGGMIGAGPVWHLAERVPVDFVLLASLAFRGTTRWGGSTVYINGVLQTDDPLADKRQTEQIDVFVLSPYLRIGHTLFVQLGPQLGLGLQTQERYLGDFAYVNLQSKTTSIVPSIQGALQIGYRF